ncbi:MAG: hypothetical protein JXB10_08935 [Pirellulales bacterium]|nr:hypothetical protein [Pirellulales bacterium]
MEINPYHAPKKDIEPEYPAKPAVSTFDWWESRRLRYNGGLVLAGILAFVGYVVVCFTLLPRVLDASEIEVNLFTTLFQGVGYLLMIGIANLFYFLLPQQNSWVKCGSGSMPSV